MTRAPLSITDLEQRLSERVRGQSDVVTTVARRLAPALAGLKLRPESPHGVFLFAGPSGVGKTELAKQIAEAAYGSSDAVIRLDMSEYGGEQDGAVKLIGAHRSWKNSSTEGLLTTKVLEKPHSVILLDEFEKSHPNVWQLFLQVFDEGRLTDGWGNTASFAETIIIMTSNLGVREGNHRVAGFGSNEHFRGDAQLAEITRTLPSEFLGRISDVVQFDTLTEGTIRELATMELDRAISRFAESGWRIRYDPKVADWLAVRSYEPASGARHLLRNIERELMPVLAASAARDVCVHVGTDGLVLKAPAESEPVLDQGETVVSQPVTHDKPDMRGL